MRVVTGGTGFLGSYLVFYLVAYYPEELLRATYRQAAKRGQTRAVFEILGTDWGWTEDAIEQAWKRVEWVYADVLDYPSLEEAFRGAREIYHAAALVSFDPKRDEAVRQTNAEGTRNAVDAALAMERPPLLIHISSTATLPDPEQAQAVDEAFRQWPRAFHAAYAESKFRAEVEVWRGEGEGLPVVVVNPSVILGPWMPGEGSSAVFETVARGMPFYPRGANAFVDVRDVAEFTLLLACDPRARSQRWLLSGHNLSYRELLETIAQALHVRPPRRKLNPAAAGMLARLEALRTALGGAAPRITPEIVQVTARRRVYKPDKVLQFTGRTFRPFEETVRWVAHWRHYRPGFLA
jgi:nucleoside-diphosphate-sugar epimerase